MIPKGGEEVMSEGALGISLPITITDSNTWPFAGPIGNDWSIEKTYAVIESMLKESNPWKQKLHLLYC